MPLKINGLTSGYTEIKAPDTAPNNTLTLPSASGALMTTGGSNTFTANQVIEVTDNTNAALRITQLGTGNALVVEDSTNPDSSPFVVDAAGKVGIGTASPTYKLTSVTPGNNTTITDYAFVGGSDTYQMIGLSENTSANEFAITNKYPSGGILTFRTGTGGTIYERLRINSSGNVGIGTTSPSAKLEANSSTAGSEVSRIEGNYSASGSVVLTNWRRSGGAVAAIMRYNDATTTMDFGTTTSHAQTFITGGTERMRIGSAGRIVIGSSSEFNNYSRLQIVGSGEEQLAIRHTSAAAGSFWRLTSDPNNTFYIINQGTTGVYIGNNSNTWSSLSDERTKDIIEPITDAANKVSRLRAVIGKYKADEEGKRRSFLIAQDVQTVLPEAVSVADPETGHLGLAYTDTIPLLTAALQEALNKIDALEARIATLEAL